jgi:hypothetical protein
LNFLTGRPRKKKFFLDDLYAALSARQLFF